MGSFDPSLLAAMFGVALLAGGVDAIAGGGGLITVPALILAGLDPVSAVATLDWVTLGPVLAPALGAVVVLVVDATAPRLVRVHHALGLAALVVGLAVALPGAVSSTGAPVRSASATVPPRVESPAGDPKSATTSVSRSPNAPVPRSEAAGPMPSARVTMKPTTSTAKAPTATHPPSQVRRQETCGLALSARVASVPCCIDGVPPGVRCGVAV